MAPNHERHDVITRALRENYASISRKFTQPVYSIFLGQQERARAFSSTLWRYFLRNGLDETDSFMQLHHPALLHNLSTELHYTVSSVSASYCIPQCVRRIAGVCTHYVVYNISKKKNTVDKSKIKDKRKVCLLHEQVFSISGWEAEIHTGHIQQCWHTLHRWEEHGRSENIYHSHQTPPGGTPTLQRQAIFKYIGGPLGGLQSAANRVQFSANVLSGLVWALQGKCRYFQLLPTSFLTRPSPSPNLCDSKEQTKQTSGPNLCACGRYYEQPYGYDD